MSLQPLTGTGRAAAALLVIGVLAAVTRFGWHGGDQLAAALAFGAVIALGEGLRITLPGGRDNAPLAATMALGYALTVDLGSRPATWGPAQVVVVVSAALLIGSIPRAIAGRTPALGYVVRRVGVTGFIAWLLRAALHPVVLRSTHSELLLLLGAVACLALMLDSALGALFAATEAAALFPLDPELVGDAQATAGAAVAPGTGRAARAGVAATLGVGADTAIGTDPRGPLGDTTPPSGTAPLEPRAGTRGPRSAADRLPVPRSLRRFFGVWFEECAATARVCPAVATLAVAVALAADPLGLWVLPITAAPVLVMQRALRRYAAIRATYQQTIRALSRITDLAGYTEPGHARRVCRLALAIGRDVGLSEPELLDLEYAALLHDLGQLSLADPLPGGATVLASPRVAAEVAARGAEVVRQTGVLDRVARVLEAQCEPYQGHASDAGSPAAQRTAGARTDAFTRTEADADTDVDTAAHEGAAAELRAAAILRVANDFEDFRNAEPGPGAQINALARIRLGLGTRYDPRVVAALARRLRLE